MTNNRPTFEDLMADIESGKVKEVPLVGPYTYAKLSKTNEESTAFERNHLDVSIRAVRGAYRGKEVGA